jgi:phage gpG-like protein
VTVGVTGDFAKLDRLRASLRELSSAGFQREISDELGRTTMKLVADEFRTETDPYGDPWREHSKNTRRKRGSMSRAKILRDSGRMAKSVNFQPTGSGFRVNIPVEYAPVHQEGATIAARSNVRGRTLWHNPDTGRLVGRNTRLKAVYETEAKRATFGEVVLPQRMMLPSSERGLGPIYLDAYNKAATAMIRRKLQVAA